MSIVFQPRFVCPECDRPIMVDISKDEVSYTSPAQTTDFLRENRKNHKCVECGAVLWVPSSSPAMQTDWGSIGGLCFVHRRFARQYLLLAETDKGGEVSNTDFVVKNDEGFWALQISRPPARGNYGQRWLPRKHFPTRIKPKQKGSLPDGEPFRFWFFIP